MNRILAILAIFFALGVAVAAVIELDSRKADDPVAIPSPSVTPGDSPSPLDSPLESPLESPRRTAAGAATSEPEPSKTQEPDETEAPEATETPEPPRTPTPEPTITVGPVDTTNGNTPHTGADSWPAGTALALAALGLRVAIVRRRSY